MEESQRSYVEPQALRNFRMAYVATVTLHDGQGEAQELRDEFWVDEDR
jgi:hypothetical protein